jgi:hypothetical protein
MSKRLVWALASVSAALVVAVPAQAKTHTERIVGGHATVTPSAQITAFLRGRGITVTPIGAMKAGNGSLTMPMVGGHMQVPAMEGTMETGGGLEYSNGSKHLRVHGYELTHAGNIAKLTAIVNGHRILIATMTAPKTHMSGNTGTMSGGLKLSAVWARRINHLVGKHVVHPGEDLGELSATMKMA